MNKNIKKTLQWSLYVILIPFIYGFIALLLTVITINRKLESTSNEKTIYLSTNGVHLDIVLEKNDLDNSILSEINHTETDRYLSFGWGDENFYINTPTWADLTLKNAFKALFLKSTTLIHVTRYKQKQSDWIKISVNETELQNLKHYLQNTFETNKNGMKIILKNKGYSTRDDFYKAKGSYSCFKTCNSWVNSGFKESGMKSCLWTPFDFGLINKYKS